MANINDSFFDGYYKEIWKTIIPDELTVKEVDFMVPYFALEEGNKVLDLMCGYGRHSIALARKGIEVTAVDKLGTYINEIEGIATNEKLPIKAINADLVAYQSAERFELVICMGNSLNFFDKDDTKRILKNISSSLKEGGHLLINSWSIAEIAYKNFTAKSWSYVGELKFFTDAKFFLQPARIETESTILSPDGNSEIIQGVDYIYYINEMETMLSQSGLSLKEVYSIPGRKKFTLGEPRAYLVAEKT